MCFLRLLLGLFLGMALGPALAGQSGVRDCVEVEPNETSSTASTVAFPGACRGNVAATDRSLIGIGYTNGTLDGVEDLFVFTLPEAAKVVLTLAIGPEGGDLDLFLFRDPGLELLEASNGSTRTESIVTAEPLPAGRYVVGVSAYAGSASYSLSMESPAVPTCVPTATAQCLSEGRFRVETRWTTPDGRSGAGQAVPLTSDTGAFWFFDAANLETVVKVLDACAFSGKRWVFATGLTNVGVVLTVTDTRTGNVKTYESLQGVAFAPIQDTSAFDSCP